MELKLSQTNGIKT